MFKIVNKLILGTNAKRMDIEAPLIAQHAKAGQYVSVVPEEDDERIPLAIIENDPVKGTITLVFQEVGETTKKLGSLSINESIFSILGPLGTAVPISKKGTVVCVAEGAGVAQIFPVARALKKAGNKVIAVLGVKNRRSLLLESQMRILCNKLIIVTEDGSFDRKGRAADVFRKLINIINH